MLAISGGRDSVALLHALLKAEYRNLVLCHLNHGLRGRASGQDAAFIRRLANKLKLPCEISRIDVGLRMRETGESMELAARNARHHFFATCSNKHRCRRVLLAHHADDQAETILFNLLRGSGGLKGMQFSRQHVIKKNKVCFIRPLLETPRSDIDYYIESNHFKYREDSSNAEAITTRNRIRHEVMPLLTDIMGRAPRSTILRAASIAENKDQELLQSIDRLQLIDPQGRLFLPKLQKLSPTLQKMALKSFLKQNRVCDINQDLLNRSLTLLDLTQPAKINLSKGKFLRRKEKRLFID